MRCCMYLLRNFFAVAFKFNAHYCISYEKNYPEVICVTNVIVNSVLRSRSRDFLVGAGVKVRLQLDKTQAILNYIFVNPHID